MRSPNQCPTERWTPAPLNGASVPDGRTSSPRGNRRQPQSSSNRSDATSILELLKGLNVPDAILEMVSNKLNPAPPEPKPEKLLLDMRLKIDSLTKECDRLEVVVRTNTTETHLACERAAIKANELLAAQQEYNELKERIDRPIEETQEPAPSSAPPVVSNPADVPVDLNDREAGMDLNNPGIEEEDDGAAPSVKRKRLDHFDRMMAGLSHFDIESLASFLGHVQIYSEQKKMLLIRKWPCRLAGNLGARGSGDFPMNVIVVSGDKKDQFFKPQSKLGENFKFFSGYAGKNRSLPSDSGPEGFQEKQSTSSYRPSFLRHVPAHVAEEFKYPEFCKRVAGLERMLRVKASTATTPGVFGERHGRFCVPECLWCLRD